MKLLSTVGCDGEGALVDAADDCSFFNSLAPRAFKVNEASRSLEHKRIKVVVRRSTSEKVGNVNVMGEIVSVSGWTNVRNVGFLCSLNQQ